MSRDENRLSLILIVVIGIMTALAGDLVIFSKGINSAAASVFILYFLIAGFITGFRYKRPQGAI